MFLRKTIVFLLFLMSFSGHVFSQCGTLETMLNEEFDNGSPIIGAITSNIYGGGSSNHNGTMIMSGTHFGWFNVVDGVGDVDLYDRYIDIFCVDSAVSVSFWTRESYGATNVTFSIIDDFSTVLATQTMTLTSWYQQVTFNFFATSPGLRFVLHCNSTGGNGKDICMENLLITQCCTPIPLNYSDLFEFISADCETINWEMEASNEVDYFVVYSSNDNKVFNEIESVIPEDTQYNFSASFSERKTYYRIETVLNNGQRFSKTIESDCNSIEKEIQSVYTFGGKKVNWTGVPESGCYIIKFIDGTAEKRCFIIK